MQPNQQLEEILLARSDDRIGRPITVVEGTDGTTLVLSRYGDTTIDLSPYITSPLCARRILLSKYPERWRNSVLDVLLAYWRYGLPGSSAPRASTVVSRSIHLVQFIRWLDSNGIDRFSKVRPIHVQRFAAYLRDTEINRNKDKRRSPQGIAQVLTAVALAWHLREHLVDALEVAPFGIHGTPGRAAGIRAQEQKQLATEPLSAEQAERLFKVCVELLEEGEKVFPLWEAKRATARPSGECSKKTLDAISMDATKQNARTVAKTITFAKAACVCLIELLAGLRIHEVLLLEEGCYFESEMLGEKLSWLRGRTLKTRPDGSNGAEWIAPPLLKRVCAFMERVSAVPRAHLEAEIARLEATLSAKGEPSGEKERATCESRISSARKQLRCLFLVRHRRGKHGSGRAFTMGTESLDWGRRNICKLAGIDYFATHQLRRTFAQMVVHMCNGDLRYLRVQFQHWTIETTALYAQYRLREQELVDEVAAAMTEYKVDDVARWLSPDTRLGAPGGEHIVRERSKPTFKATLFEDRLNLARSVAKGLVIRPTGHSWCVSTGEPTCGGAGIYDATICADCDGAVVEEQHRTIWELLDAQLNEVKSLGDCGPAVDTLVEESLASFEKILIALGPSIAQGVVSSGRTDG